LTTSRTAPVHQPFPTRRSSDLLFYIGKKVLIVGDDKQISPTHVGVNREHVHQRMREFLDDFEHRGSFDLERSLFDHGELRIGNRDRKSTRLNSSHVKISYAVFC